MSNWRRAVKIPVTLQKLVLERRSFIALTVFLVGLYSPPVAFLASGFHRYFGLSLRPYLDYFEWLALAFGLVCCLVAPFLPREPLGKKFVFLAVAIMSYAADLLVSTILSVAAFGMP